MRCHACDAHIEIAAGERVGFRDECQGCARDLHVCLNCAHHDPAAYNQCRESSAERVGDRDRSNRCEYFRPGDRERTGSGPGTLDALEALFKKR